MSNLINVLPGSSTTPEFLSLVIYKREGNRYACEKTTKVTPWNTIGYVPGISIISGGCRGFLGTILLIGHLAAFIFDKKERAFHMQQVKFCAKHVVRGALEMSVVANSLGLAVNFSLFFYDLIRGPKLNELNKEFDAHQNNSKSAAYENHAILFYDREEYHKMPVAEFEAKAQRLGMSPDRSELMRMFRKVQ